MVTELMPAERSATKFWGVADRSPRRGATWVVAAVGGAVATTVEAPANRAMVTRKVAVQRLVVGRCLTASVQDAMATYRRVGRPG